ncbi:hypothetical protein B0A48_10840 [Cryoendolithus antarcticus]|uniref:MMS19 nucleotide excision repair protein n=1 Tax=Cryoendolithus antarcticus TaxID=1507870 RepID=A0A1V8SYT3_9PEZI|nr:hypothetical protein B0A48_10840 [Cryoendolithus antarcticus]
MSDIQQYLFEVDKNKSAAKDVAQNSARKLESKELKLINLITDLEPYINAKDDAARRSNSIGYLADVLDAVSPRVLSGQERRLLVDFILNRLESDTEGIGSSARALLALERLGKWDSTLAQRVLQTFVDHANPLKQFKLQSERYAILQLIDLLMAKYRTALQSLHDSDANLLPSFIALFEGEKDPRNLMIVFSVLQVPLAEWDVHAYAQDLFDAVFNYFPITFKPPPDDPYGITAQDLKDRLKGCIAASGECAPYAFPALLDKLDSTAMNTKRDVLHTIQACVVSYEPKTVNLYSVTLWDALKFEILAAQEEDLVNEALKALALIATAFSTGMDGPLTAYLRPIVKECNEHLEDAPTTQSRAAGRILHAVSSAAPVVADRIVKGILPTLFTLFKSSESIAKRRGLIEVLNEILKAYIDMHASGDALILEGLKSHSSDALEVMLRATVSAPKAEVSFRLASLNGLVQLTAIPKLLSDEEVERTVDAVTDMVLHEQTAGHGDIRTEAIAALTEMAHTVPDTVRNKAIPAMMVDLPDSPSDDTSYKSTLEALARLSTETEIFDTIVVRLKSRLSAARHHQAPTSYQHALLLALLYAFTYGSPLQEDGAVRSSYFGDYAEPLLALIKEAAPGSRDSAETEIVGRITNILLRSQTPHFQSTVYRTSLQRLVDEQRTKGESVQSLAPLSLHYFAALRPEVVEPTDVHNLLKTLGSLLLDGANSDASTSVLLRHITLLVNKFLTPKTMQASLQDAGLDVTPLLAANPTQQQIHISLAITKALILLGKTSALTSTYLHVLLDLLPAASTQTAQAFATLLAPDALLSKVNHCTVSPLHKQRTFALLTPSLLAALKTAEPSRKQPYLLALAGILQHIPYTVLQPSLLELVPSLLQVLDLPTSQSTVQDVKPPILAILEAALLHDPDTLSEHASSLITRLLTCASPPLKSKSSAPKAPNTTTVTTPGSQPPPSVNSPAVRAKALQCLTLLPTHLKREVVLPFRRQIIRKLVPSLDDSKRSVRTEAVKCRGAWMGMEEEAAE